MDEAPRVAELSPEPVRSEAADVAIGLWTVGDSSKVETVARIVQDGILTHLAGHTAVLIHVDASVPDEAREQAEHAADGLRVVRVPLVRSGAADRPQAGWCEAVRAVLGTSRTLHTRAVVMLNAGISSTTPEWIRGLAQPVLKDGCGFVLPVYQRGRYEGTLTQLFVVPLLRALFGHQFWYPIADEFACSAEAAEFLLAQDVWTTDIARQGLEFWLPVAMCGQAFPFVQSVLGTRAVSSQRPPAPLGPTVGRVAGA